ncbi:hypothetical protein BGZ98_000981, partial [Dissophora globulifera]
MSERRVQLDADEQNRLFQLAKSTEGNSAGQQDESGDESSEETGVVSRGIPGEEPEAHDGDFLADFPDDTEELELTHLRIDDVPALNLERFKNLQ